MARDEFSFAHRLRVRWSETDMQGIVFNGHYLNYFDVAFTEYWRATGLPHFLEQARDGHELFARKATLEYHAPARFDDELDVCVRVARFGRSSMGVLLEIHRSAPGAERDAAHLISGELVYVHTQAAARRPVAIPDAWRDVLARFERTPIVA